MEGRKGESEMKRAVICLALLTAFGLSGCGKKSAETGWPGHEGFYTTVVKYSGENESDAKYLEIARKSEALLPLLEEKAGAFVVDAYNFQSIDDEGTPLYTQNTLSYPEEIAPNGRSIRVSPNYFAYNPVETADGSDVRTQLVVEDTTLNLLVPEQFKSREADILKGYRELFYFEKVTAEDSFNEMAGLPDRLDIAEEDLTVRIIYMKEGQQYFTFRRDCKGDGDTPCYIDDPIVQIYTGNIHCNYAHSFLSQWTYFPSDAENGEEAFEVIRPWVEETGAAVTCRPLG